MLNAKNIILSLSIAVVFVLFAFNGLNLFYPEPSFEDFCGVKEYPRVVPLEKIESCDIGPSLISEQNECLSKGNVIINREYNDDGCLSNFECSSCNKDHEKASAKWGTKALIAATIVGLIGVVVGALLFKIESIGAGLMGGGALLIFIFSTRVWRDLGDVLRFIILGIALVVLIYIGILINRKRSTKNK